MIHIMCKRPLLVSVKKAKEQPCKLQGLHGPTLVLRLIYMLYPYLLGDYLST